MMQTSMNYVAVLVAAIANMGLGFLWYGPLFGKQWTSLMGWSKEQMEAGQAKMKSEGWKTYLLAFIGSVVMAWVLAYFVVGSMVWFNWGDLTAGLTVAFLAWLGFVAPVTVGSVLWEGKSWKLWLLLNSYHLASLLVMGAIVAILA